MTDWLAYDTALGGVALGLVTGVSPLVAAMAFSVGVAWSIGWISERGRVTEETAIGILFPTTMALGIAIISLSATYRQDLMAYLFGSMLAVRTADLWLLVGLAAGTLSVLALFFKELVFLSIDPDAARAAKIPVTALRYLLHASCRRYRRLDQARRRRTRFRVAGHSRGDRAARARSIGDRYTPEPPRAREISLHCARSFAQVTSREPYVSSLARNPAKRV